MSFAALCTRGFSQAKCPSSDEPINKMRYILKMDYYSVVKRKDVPTPTTTGINLENILSEVSQAQKAKCCTIPLI